MRLVHGPADAQLHPGQLRRDRPGQRPKVPDVRGWNAVVLPDPPPKTVKFKIDDGEPERPVRSALLRAGRRRDQPADAPALRPGQLHCTRSRTSRPPTTEAKVIGDLSRAGKRLMGFCRTNLFKRLESSGQAFLQSVERHILRNFVFLHALENGLPCRSAPRTPACSTARFNDAGPTTCSPTKTTTRTGRRTARSTTRLRTEAATFVPRAAEVYATYAGPLKKRFRWLPPSRFSRSSAKDLQSRHPGSARRSQEVRRVGTETRCQARPAGRTCLTASTPSEKVFVFTPVRGYGDLP